MPCVSEKRAAAVRRDSFATSMGAHYIDNCERRVSFSFSGLLEIKKRVAAYTRSVQYVADLYIVVASPIGVCC